MAKEEATSHSDSEAPIEIDLRNPVLAALLAWLWPGAGHLYQRRHVKGVLFMVCVLTTYFIGMVLGQGRVVYASWAKADRRWQYFCQVGVGLPALPALVQNRLVRSGEEPLFGGLMAPPVVVMENCRRRAGGLARATGRKIRPGNAVHDDRRIVERAGGLRCVRRALRARSGRGQEEPGPANKPADAELVRLAGHLPQSSTAARSRRRGCSSHCSASSRRRGES